ncbi:hypothetical protein PNOK_0719100 [Pyrrhoderma noxium]|uniref:Uncharacterized protein n=1 Tax=Pyrrhoderma noxium TaxID=2282107 RepID=A0A286UC42_9AGAM|nr:hypothetical protein PNOK_0719100 [Pyrrhoderma noxium]
MHKEERNEARPCSEVRQDKALSYTRSQTLFVPPLPGVHSLRGEYDYLALPQDPSSLSSLHFRPLSLSTPVRDCRGPGENGSGNVLVFTLGKNYTPLACSSILDNFPDTIQEGLEGDTTHTPPIKSQLASSRSRACGLLRHHIQQEKRRGLQLKSKLELSVGNTIRYYC